MKAETHAETIARQERQVASRVVTRKPVRPVPKQGELPIVNPPAKGAKLTITRVA